MSVIWIKIQESWKAVVALLIPLLWTAAIDLLDGLAETLNTDASWPSAIVLSVIAAVSVWLKANRPPS
jgi:hypothetical protein